MTLRISEQSAASPDMPDAAFAELVEDIKRRGQLVPIWRCGDEIIDGRKRFRACTLLGIAPVVVDMSPDQDQAALSYSLNILRTHYTRDQRAMAASKMATAVKADGTARRVAAKARPLDSEVVKQMTKTVPEAAGEAGVATSAVFAARRISREAAPEVAAAVESGALSLYAADQIRASVAKEHQAAAVVKRIAAGKGRRRRARADAGRVKVPGYHRSPRRPLGRRMDRALDQLDNALGALSDFLQEPDAPQHADRGTWATRLTGAKGELAKLISYTTRGRSTA